MTVLNDAADLASWNNQGLPSDLMSLENATILTNCARWPLIVDPQLQGINWLKNRYKKNLKVVRLDRKGLVNNSLDFKNKFKKKKLLSFLGT